MCAILIMNGPNLGALGQRQPEIYGHLGMEALPALLNAILGQKHAVTLDIFQSNHEGALLDRLEAARSDGTQGIVLNAGAFTHTSLALADCLAWIGLPCVEVHLSNTLARHERLRHKSLLAPHTLGLIAGFGLTSYALGIQALVQYLQKKHAEEKPCIQPQIFARALK